MGKIIRRALLKLAAFLPFLAANAKNSDALAAGSKEKSAAATLALEKPPGCIAAFSSTPIEIDGDLDICARFQLTCKKCSSSNLKIMCYPIVVKEEGKYAMKEIGDVIERNPHHVVCTECGERHLVFDSRKHGYDGALGNESSYENGTGKEKPIACEIENYHVHVVFTYNIELDELNEIAEREKLEAQELFDWFHIIAITPEGEELRDINYECA